MGDARSDPESVVWFNSDGSQTFRAIGTTIHFGVEITPLLIRPCYQTPDALPPLEGLHYVRVPKLHQHIGTLTQLSTPGEIVTLICMEIHQEHAWCLEIGRQPNS